MSENVLDEQLSRGEHRAQPELLMPHTVLARTAADLAAKYEGWCLDRRWNAVFSSPTPRYGAPPGCMRI